MQPAFSRASASAPHLCMLLMRMAGLEAFAQTGCEPTHVEVLLTILFRWLERDQCLPPLTPSLLATSLERSPESIQSSLQSLVDEGLVTAGSYTLTHSGILLADRLATWPTTRIQPLEELSEGERTALYHDLVWHLAHLQMHGAIPALRVCATCDHFHPYRHTDSAQPHVCRLTGQAFSDSECQLRCAEHSTLVPLADIQSVAKQHAATLKTV